MEPDSYDRRCVQTTLYMMLPSILRSFAPILPLVAEEANAASSFRGEKVKPTD